MGNLETQRIPDLKQVETSENQIIFHVSSPHALLHAIGYLKYTAKPWERIYLRGQGELYETLRPTLYRNIIHERTQVKRHSRLNKIIKEFINKSSLLGDIPEYAVEPLLQHYGIKSTWLDIVDNIWIALWFAIHKTQVSGTQNQYMHFDVRSNNDKSKYGYILLIKTDGNNHKKALKGLSRGTHTEVIDLRIAAPSVFLRPHAQHGMLYRVQGTSEGRPLSYNDTISAIIRFDIKDARLWLGNGSIHNVRSLFPPPFYDKGYQILLDIKLDDSTLGVITHIGA